MFFVDYAHFTEERGIDRSVVREAKRRGIVASLAKIVPLAQDSIAPRRYPLLLGRVIHIRANIELVCWIECDLGLVVERKGIPSAHLQLQLIIVVQCFEIANLDELPSLFVA